MTENLSPSTTADLIRASLEKIEQAIKDLLIGWIESNLTNMFTDVNEKVGTIAAEVGQTPSGWNGSIYQMIRGLSENVIVPIAGRQTVVTAPSLPEQHFRKI